MKNLEAAGRRARELFGAAISSVSYYTRPEWRCSGWRGFRVTMAGNVIHWMTPDGRHQKAVCCPDAKQRQGRTYSEGVEVVRR